MNVCMVPKAERTGQDRTEQDKTEQKQNDDSQVKPLFRCSFMLNSTKLQLQLRIWT